MPENDTAAMIERLKRSRGLAEEEELATHSWHDPSVFPDASKAANRVRDALAAGERIGIFGDYDCDGITAAAQMLRMIRRHGSEPVMRLPHRIRDGYGVKTSHIAEFADAGVTLLITVDTGINAHDAMAAARADNIDVIVLDHHHLLSAPDAFAILHASLAPLYPHPHPAAAGVAFRFVHAVEGDTWQDRDIDLALAMIGTVADLVQLQGHNRTLVREGLQALQRLPDCPLRSLAQHVSSGKSISSIDVAFRIAPRINAAGRMANPLLALHAILEGGTALQELETLNTLRQEETLRSLDLALQNITPGQDGSLPSFLSVASASYPPGILGLVAGKLTDRFGRPSLAANIRGDTCTASLRSPAGYNVTEALARVGHFLTSFGGHAQAAGAVFPLERAVELFDALEEDAATRLSAQALVPSISIDAELSPSAVTRELCTHVQDLEPFGQGNPEPQFLIRNVRITQARRCGADGRHLQGSIGQTKLIGFGLGPLIDQARTELDVVCRIGLDSWNGREAPQLFLQDLRLAAHA